jgi:hypothetical protein
MGKVGLIYDHIICNLCSSQKLKYRLKLEDIKARNGISNAGEMGGFRSMEQ